MHELYDFTTAAVEAAERGWAVTPLHPNSKIPAVKWKTENAWHDNPEYVAAKWWEGHNIGLVLEHSGLLVIDLDRHGRNDGVTAFTRLCSEHQPDGQWPNTYTVSTPSGGYHLYFENPGSLGCSTGVLPRGIDVKGVGGVVTAAGSVIDGTAYKVDSDVPVLPLPEWLEKLITTRKRPARKYADHHPDRRPRRERLRRAETLIDWLLDAPVGERNRCLYWTACRIAEMGLPEEDTERWLTLAGREIGLEEFEVEATIGSAFREAA